jgi:cbb3-type cytochrome oxidase subunit 3
MFKEWLAGRGLGVYPLVAMAIFIAVFLAVLAHTFLGRGRKENLNRLSMLPFDDEGGRVDQDSTQRRSLHK